MISQLSINFMAVIFAAAYIFYPVRSVKVGMFTYSFRRRVRHDVILLASSAWIVTGSVNQFAHKPVVIPVIDIPVTMMVANDVHGIGKRAEKLGIKEMVSKIKDFRKGLKQKLNEQKGEYREKSTGAKVALILLTLFCATIAFTFIASAACSLSCSGNEGLAAVVGIGGTIGIIVLTVIAIRAILKKKKVETPVTAPVL